MYEILKKYFFLKERKNGHWGNQAGNIGTADIESTSKIVKRYLKTEK